MRILAIDPGVTTGLCFWDSERPDSMSADMLTGAFDALNWINEMFRMSRLDMIVMEEFRITTRTIGKGTSGSNTAIEIIGAIKYLAYCLQLPIVMQTPSDALSFVTDAKLKRLGWYTPGKDHPRDATRHLVLYLVNNGLLDPAKLLS